MNNEVGDLIGISNKIKALKLQSSYLSFSEMNVSSDDLVFIIQSIYLLATEYNKIHINDGKYMNIRDVSTAKDLNTRIDVPYRADLYDFEHAGNKSIAIELKALNLHIERGDDDYFNKKIDMSSIMYLSNSHLDMVGDVYYQNGMKTDHNVLSKIVSDDYMQVKIIG